MVRAVFLPGGGENRLEMADTVGEGAADHGHQPGMALSVLFELACVSSQPVPGPVGARQVQCRI